jgi:hypothetical protein
MSELTPIYRRLTGEIYMRTNLIYIKYYSQKVITSQHSPS